MGIIDGLKNLFNTSGSQRRSRLNVGVAKWEDSQPWFSRGCIDSFHSPFVLFLRGKLGFYHKGSHHTITWKSWPRLG